MYQYTDSIAPGGLLLPAKSKQRVPSGGMESTDGRDISGGITYKCLHFCCGANFISAFEEEGESGRATSYLKQWSGISSFYVSRGVSLCGSATAAAIRDTVPGAPCSLFKSGGFFLLFSQDFALFLFIKGFRTMT